ncbi:hypothetical protein Fmac_025051 [Flemingia macrophylla]|uniref:Uncharacterized protein n=1 Tax=Flemingia macrophylla TaxID=520843 RepID=A0ABD1LR33_9FABA
MEIFENGCVSFSQVGHLGGFCLLYQILNNIGFCSCILSAATASQVTNSLQSPSAFIEPAFIYNPYSSYVLGIPVTSMPLSSWNYNATPPLVNVAQPQVTREVLFVLNSDSLFYTFFFLIQICRISTNLFCDEFESKEGPSNLESFGLLDGMGLTRVGQVVPLNYCYSSSNESAPPTWPSSKRINQGD